MENGKIEKIMRVKRQDWQEGKNERVRIKNSFSRSLSLIDLVSFNFSILTYQKLIYLQNEA